MWLIGLQEDSTFVINKRKLSEARCRGHSSIEPLPNGKPSTEETNEAPSTLYALLKRPSNRKCTDSHNHVYAILGMATPAVTQADSTPAALLYLTIDYTNNVAQSFPKLPVI